MELEAAVERWPMRSPFRIAGEAFVEAELVVVTLRDGRLRGRGEACGVYYRADGPDRMIAMIESVSDSVRAGADRAALLDLLPAGGARNAIDCALWELEAQRAGVPVRLLAKIGAAPPLPTVFTIGVDHPDKMAEQARAMRHAHAIKLKLAGDGEDGARLHVVRAARPDAWLGVDGNRGFTLDAINALIPVLEAVGVDLLEQPLAIGREAEMAALDGKLITAADESVQDIDDLAPLKGLFDAVNIKLDKCGGLTRGLQMAAAARALGFKVMVGNMTGTSWSQAPAFLLGQICDYRDLDGPTFLAADRVPGVRYEDGLIHCTDQVWGC